MGRIKQTIPYTRNDIIKHIGNKTVNPGQAYPYRETAEFWGEVFKELTKRKSK